MVPHVAADPEAEAPCQRMLDSWVAFARTGQPAREGTPSCTPYTATDRATMEIERTWALVRDPLGRECAAWDDVPTGPASRPWSRIVA